MPKPTKKKLGGLSGKLQAVEPEFCHALYKKIVVKRRGNVVSKVRQCFQAPLKTASVDKVKFL